ncbi:MAG: hypothetical protein DRN57_08525, partial [Thermoplasmata archaeon]
HLWIRDSVMNRPRTDIGTFAGCDDDSDVVINSSDVDSEIVIYVSDHGHMVDSESALRFSDGNISYSTMGNSCRSCLKREN